MLDYICIASIFAILNRPNPDTPVASSSTRVYLNGSIYFLVFRFMEREKDALIHRANSLKRAIRNLVEHTEQVVDEQNRQSTSAIPTVKISLSSDLDKADSIKMDSLKVMPTIESGGSSEASSCPSPTSSILTARLANISPMPDVRRDSAFGSDDTDLLTLPVPADFADSRRASQIQQQK